MNQKTISGEIIFNFCTKILPEFNNIMENLGELHSDLSPHEFAMNLMDLGRGQMSEIDEPGEQDVDFIDEYITSLNLKSPKEAFFTAYAGGCIMGLVSINKIAREDFGNALRLIENFAQKEFNGNDS